MEMESGPLKDNYPLQTGAFPLDSMIASRSVKEPPQKSNPKFDQFWDGRLIALGWSVTCTWMGPENV